MPSTLDVRAPARQLDLMDPEQMMGTRAVATRYDISMRALDRWLDRPDLGFPGPTMVIGIRRYWRLGDLTAWERVQAVRSAAKRKASAVSAAADSNA
jgi:hypothetical protein